MTTTAKTRQCIALALFEGCLVLAALTASAETKTWLLNTQKARGYWDDPAQWSPAGVPGPGDDVVIQGKATYCHVSNSISVASITVGNKCNLEVGVTTGTEGGDYPYSFTPGKTSAVADANNSPVAINITGNLTIIENGALIVGRPGWGRIATINVGGDLFIQSHTSSKEYQRHSFLDIWAGETNATHTIQSGSAFLDVAGTTTLTNGYKNGGVIHFGGDPNMGSTVIASFGDVEIAEGCSVNANAGGYNWNRSAMYAGPGTSVTSGNTQAGSYGGRGLGNENPSLVYGEPDAPYWLGSACIDNLTKDSGAAGGGAVRITAGNIVVNGSIAANGGQDGYESASGGSVWIKCDALSGAGSITASGGVNGRANQYNRYCGGGGRIALDVKNDVGDDFQLTVGAPCGGYGRSEYVATADLKSGEAGSIWANKAAILARIYPRCTGGAFYCPEFGETYDAPFSAIPERAAFYFPTVKNLVFPNGLTIGTSAILGFGMLGSQSGVGTSYKNIGSEYDQFQRDDGGAAERSLTINGNLAMATNSWLLVNGRSNGEPGGFVRRSTVTVAGDIVQEGGISVVGNMVGDAYGHGWTNPPTLFNVGGNWTMASNALTYARCETLTGGPVRFSVGKRFTGAEGSTFSAYNGGYSVTNSHYLSFEGSSQAPGRPIYSNMTTCDGGAYGGTSNSDAKRYGSPFMPFRPGSHSGMRQDGSNTQCAGGGVIFFGAKAATFGGVFSADGVKNSDYSGRGSSSGGAICIMLASADLVIEPTAVFTAKGGNGKDSDKQKGGGGRIAIGLNMDKARTDAEIARLVALGDPYAEVDEELGITPEKVWTDEEIADDFPGATFNVLGGDELAAAAGTVRLYRAKPLSSPLIIIVR